MSTTSLTEKEIEQQLLEAAAAAAVIPEWTPEATAALHRARDGKKVIAICGFSPMSRHLAPFDDERVYIIGVNEAHRHKTGYMKRWDAWMQLHKRWDFTKASSDATREHWAWLQEKHDFPIYMQEHWDDIPSSVPFPMSEIKEKFPGVVELLPTGEELERDYYTSTFAYMCALAMLEIEKQELPGRIEVYGFDMATGTEFIYQKGSTEYWIGYARGKGIEVTVPYKCRLINGKLYGFEVSRVIPRHMLVTLSEGASEIKSKLEVEITDVSNRRQEAETRAMALQGEERNKIVVDEARPLFNQEIDLAKNLNVVHGEWLEYQDLIAYIDKAKTEDQEMLINRQFLEFRMNSINKDRQDRLNTAMVMRGRRSMIDQELVASRSPEMSDDKRNEIEQKGIEAINNEFNAASIVNAFYGRNKACVGLLRYLDNMMEDDKMILAVMESDPIKKEEGF